MGTSFQDIKKRKKPNEVSVEILVDVELNRILEELTRRHDREARQDAKLNRDPKAPAIAKEIDELQEKVADATVTFRFRDPGRRAFDALMEACPPTPEEKKEHNFDWHPHTFVPGLLALCAVEPELSEADALEIYDNWGRGDVEALFSAALQACLERASIPFTKRDTEGIVASVRNLITQPTEESPTPSS